MTPANLVQYADIDVTYIEAGEGYWLSKKIDHHLRHQQTIGFPILLGCEYSASTTLHCVIVTTAKPIIKEI